MQKYNLLLKNTKGKLPAELYLEHVLDLKIPSKGEIIHPDFLREYIAAIAIDEKHPEYIENFSFSSYRVKEVDHFPIKERGGLEPLLKVTAVKI
jgi:hypothetical protein